MSPSRGPAETRDYVRTPAVACDLATLEEDRALAQTRDRLHVVGDEDDRPSGRAEILHAPEAALLKLRVADGQDFIHEQDLGLEMCSHCEREADRHPTRVALHGCVDEPLDASKLNDLRKLLGNLAALHPEDRAVEIDILASGELWMETGSDLEQASDPSANLCPPLRRGRDPREELQQSRLPRTVMSDHAEHLALRHLKRDVPQGPDLLVVVPVWPARHPPADTDERLTQSAVARL